MSFGGGSGFSPSRTVVEDSTKTGNDTGQKHQFTGSVEITGDHLKLNGVSITGGGGGGTPGGSDTQVQYNDGGAFGGDTEFFYNDSTNSLTVGGKLMVGAASTPAFLCHLTSSSEVVLTLQGPGDVGIRLAADKDGGVGEDDNPYIDWYQDGQNPTSRNNRLASIAMEGDANQSFTGSLDNAIFIDAFCPNSKHSNVRRFQIATDAKYNKWNDQAAPRQGSHTARMTIEGERGFVGIGDNNAPTATLHVSSSQGTPLFRVDHTGTLGPDPVLFVTGSGQVGIGTETPTHLLHVSQSADSGGDNLLFRVDAYNQLDPAIDVKDNGTESYIGINTSAGTNALTVNAHSAGSIAVRATNGHLGTTQDAYGIKIGTAGATIVHDATDFSYSDTAETWKMERVAQFAFSGAKAGSNIAGGGTNHVLGTLPAGAFITDAYLDVTSVFAVANPAVAIALGTATTYAIASNAILDQCQPSAIPRTGGTIDATASTGVISLPDGSGLAVQYPGTKLPSQENVVLNVADGSGGSNGLTASGATLYIKYIVM